ncbi:hypothetical protein E4U17_001737, partial [Claviceps sp. LM77 group G4]
MSPLAGPSNDVTRGSRLGSNLADSTRARPDVHDSAQDPEASDRLTRQIKTPYDNRILSVLAISPSEDPLVEYKSILDLLECLRDAIKAHRSLYMEYGPTEEDSNLAVEMMNDIETEGLAAATAGDDEHSIDSMFKLWQQVIYAPTKTDFDNAWKAMKDQYEDQQHTLDYISDEYMPLLHQWAKYEIDQYRNFGQR